MSDRKLHIATHPLTGRILQGRARSSNGRILMSQTTDVTADVLLAVIQKAKQHGGSFDIHSYDGDGYTLSVVAKGSAAQAAAGAQPYRPEMAPLSDEQLKKLSATGPVHCENGVVTRGPAVYRDELQERFERGFRTAEKHYGISRPTPTTPKAQEGEQHG
ncbi:hypothetical protein HNP48_002297 [Acidovorax soli]|uniref:Uncharacterized protein n=1 Tax=Acidovorax soli TaxID=592050 RepID=A0A7X0PCY5_9BURK|nr:hypothetical protein [Acidovorax soli]MBB6559630.1 hypothetical protein [Acidovorax soli]